MARRPKFDPKTEKLLLLGGGGAAIATAAIVTRNKARPGYTPDFYQKPKIDWAMVPATQRQILIDKYGGVPIGYRNNVHPLPIMYMGDMSAVDTYWRGVASRASGSSSTVRNGEVQIAQDLLEAHNKRMNAVKAAIYTNRGQAGPAALASLSGSALPWTSIPFVPTKSEIEAFWNAIDKTALAVHARLSWNQEEYNSIATHLGVQATAVAKAAGEAVSKAAFLGLKAFLLHPAFLVGAAAVGWYFIQRRRG